MTAQETEKQPSRASPKLIPLAIIIISTLGYGASRLWLSRQPFEWSGTIESRTISVGSRVGGRVYDVLVHEGDHVDANQPIVVLEPGDLHAQKLAAEGQVAQAQANLDKLERGARPEEVEAARARAESAAAAFAESKAGARQEQIASARARLVAAEVAAEKASLDAERMRQLLEKGATSKAERDTAAAQERATIAQRDAQAHLVEELENGVRDEEKRQAAARAKEAAANAKLVEAGARVEDIQAARGVLEAARGKLEQISVMIEELTIKAPRPARVESLDLRPGDIVPPNATAAVLLEEGQLYVRIYVPETQLGYVKVTEKVPISVDSFPDRVFAGRIEHISNVGEFSPRNLQTADERADQVFACRVGIIDGAESLRAGMAAFIKVPRP